MRSAPTRHPRTTSLMAAGLASLILAAAPAGAADQGQDGQMNKAADQKSDTTAMHPSAPRHGEDSGDGDKSAADIWHEARLMTTYLLSDDLSGFDLYARVNDGTAHLSGKVASRVQKALAEQIAQEVDGIEQVENMIRVEHGLSRGARDPYAAAVGNASVASRVHARLLWHDATEDVKAKVKAQGGNVTLFGNVDSEAQRMSASEIALNTRGVDTVDNRMVVETGAPSEDSASDVSFEAAERELSELGDAARDAWISSKVYSSLLFDDRFSPLDLDVNTEGGTVYLEGQVGSEAVRRALQEEVKSISGVEQVDVSKVRLATMGLETRRSSQVELAV